MASFCSRVLVFVLLVGCGGLAIAQSGESRADKTSDSDWVAQKTQTCAGCHGKNGVSQNATFPSLAGQYQNYLLHSLKAYREGTRENAIMAGQVQGMSDAQLEALAHYYSEQGAGPLHTPYVD